MDKKKMSQPIDLKDLTITDSFWKNEMELVRKEVIPYQWDALNDNIPDAAKSYCMHNFRAAGALNEKARNEAKAFVAPTYTFRGFEALPEDPENPDPDKFYGFVFQDTDFSKWVEAVAYSLTQHPDPALEKLADGAIDVVCKAQAPDGYLDTYYIINGRDKTFSNLRDHHELYCLGHLIEGAVAYYQATGKRKLLDAAARFADYCADYFGEEEGKCKGYPGHEIAEMALVRLYEVTENEKYLKLARFFIDERGKQPYYFDQEEDHKVTKDDGNLRYDYHQAHLPVRQQKEATGHAVRAVYLYSGMADVARITGDQELLTACQTIWDDIVSKQMYITGGIGSTREGEAFTFAYDLPNDLAYSETCASIGMVFFARRMLQIEANSKYADIMERELYNVVLSGMAMDGKSFFYVNPLESVPEACHKDIRKFHVKPVRQKWFGCACCPPNIARTLSSLGSYCFTANQDTLFVHLYMGAEIETEIAGEKVKVKIDSKMPENGLVKIKVDTDKKDLKLAVRIPEWCQGKYQINGAEIAKIENGYAYIDGAFENEITFDFDMPVRIMHANLKVRENLGKVALLRGPICYAIEEADNGADLHLVSVDTTCGPETFTKNINGQDFTAIKMAGSRLETKAVDDALYTSDFAAKESPATLTFIPYFMWANRGEGEMTVWVAQQ